MWKIIDTGIASAEENMRLDKELLENVEDRPILHFYDWKEKSATYGYFVSPQEFISLEAARKHSLTLAKRPTGGGIVFHLWDLAFSVIVPSTSAHFSRNTLENYAFVNEAVLQAVKEFVGMDPSLTLQDEKCFDLTSSKFCMARPTKYDVVIKGKKVAGAAQRKIQKGFLHQGTIALQMPEEDFLSEILVEGNRVAEAMQFFTYPLLGRNPSKEKCRNAKTDMQNLLDKYLTEKY